MNRLIKTIRNIVVIVILLIVFLATTGMRLTPIQAHEQSEKSLHYGPSDIIKVFDYGNYQHILCKYDKWVSCDTVNRNLFIFWAASTQVLGIENDKMKPLDWNGNSSEGNYFIYGIVNSTDIVKVELQISEGDSFVQEEFYDNLFYFTWEPTTNEWGIIKLIGYDINGEIVYETENR